MSSGRGSLKANLALVLASVVAALALAEGVLALRGYRFSPIVFRDPAPDWRAFHVGAPDARLPGHDPLTVFDPFLLWRLDPRASREISPGGFRGEEPVRKGPRDFLIVTVGDSNTLGPLDAPDHWPGFLQDLARLNRSDRRVSVVNAGVYGYSSMQGLRRLDQVLALGPDLVYFSFGANDAHRVQLTDAAYARRAAWLSGLDRLRLVPPLAHRVWVLMDSLRGQGRTERVPLPEYRANLEQAVARIRGAGAVPVLLTRPYLGESEDPEEWLTYVRDYNQATLQVAASQRAASVDVQAELGGARELFADDSHFNRRGYQRMAALLVQHLARLRVLKTDFVYPSDLDLGQAPDTEPALGKGLWPAEPWGDDRGRWTEAEASVLLERHGDERGLLVDLSFERPDGGPTSGRIEVNGRTLRRFSERNGRWRWRLDVSGVPGRGMACRIVVDAPFVPEAGAGERDRRTLGAVLHRLALVQSPAPLRPAVEAPFLCSSAVAPGEIDDDRPEIQSGFWAREAWPDGSGRWTRAEATLLLERHAGEKALFLDLSLFHPSDPTRARIEVNRVPLLDLEGPNGRVRRWLDLSRVPGRFVAVRFVVDSAYVPDDEDPDPDDPDERELGLFVRSARLAGAPDLP